MSYDSTVLHGRYRRRWAGVKDVKDDLKRIEIIGIPSSPPACLIFKFETQDWYQFPLV